MASGVVDAAGQIRSGQMLFGFSGLKHRKKDVKLTQPMAKL